MNLTQIKEHNRLISEFMGSKYINSPYKANKEDDELTDFWHWSIPESGWPKDAYTGQEYSTGFMIENWAYHKSWDWLMPVIEKISKLNLPDPDGVSQDWQPFPRTFGMLNDDNGNFMFRFNRYGIHDAPKLIDAAYSAVVEFILSNQQNEPNPN